MGPGDLCPTCSDEFHTSCVNAPHFSNCGCPHCAFSFKCFTNCLNRCLYYVPWKNLAGLKLKTGSGTNILQLRQVHYLHLSIHQQNPIIEVLLSTPLEDLMPLILPAHLLRLTYWLLISLERNLNSGLPTITWALVFPNSVAILNLYHSFWKASS